MAKKSAPKKIVARAEGTGPHMAGGGAASLAAIPGGPGHTAGGGASIPAALPGGGPHTLIFDPKKTVGGIKVEYAADGSVKLTLLP